MNYPKPDGKVAVPHLPHPKKGILTRDHMTDGFQSTPMNSVPMSDFPGHPLLQKAMSKAAKVKAKYPKMGF